MFACRLYLTSSFQGITKMPRKSAAERQRIYRERIKRENPQKYEEQKRKVAALSLQYYYRNKQKTMTAEQKEQLRQLKNAQRRKTSPARTTSQSHQKDKKNSENLPNQQEPLHQVIDDCRRKKYINNQTLIEQVRENRCLWDPSCRESIVTKRKTWNKISKLFKNTTGFDCKYRWRRLRDARIASKKKQMSKYGNHKPYKYDVLMSFLDVVEKDERDDCADSFSITWDDSFDSFSSKISEEEIPESKDIVLSFGVDHDYDARGPTLDQQDDPTNVEHRINIRPIMIPGHCEHELNSHQSTISIENRDRNNSSGSSYGQDTLSLPTLTPAPKFRRQHSGIDYDDISESHPRPQTTQEAQNITADEHTHFALSLVPLMRSLPPRVASGIRIKIYQIIHNATEVLNIEDENPLRI